MLFHKADLLKLLFSQLMPLWARSLSPPHAPSVFPLSSYRTAGQPESQGILFAKSLPVTLRMKENNSITVSKNTSLKLSSQAEHPGIPDIPILLFF